MNHNNRRGDGQHELPWPTRRGDQLRMLRDCRLGDSQSHHLLRVIDDHIGRSGTWDISVDDLAAEMECSPSTVYRRLRDLRGRGIIDAEILGGQRYRLRIIWPAVADHIPGQADPGHSQPDTSHSQPDTDTINIALPIAPSIGATDGRAADGWMTCRNCRRECTHPMSRRLTSRGCCASGGEATISARPGRPD